MKVNTKKTMEFTFTKEERMAIELTRNALKVIMQAMGDNEIDYLTEVTEYDTIEYAEVEEAADVLANLLDGKLWKESK